jgi:hypothetical protein
MAMSADFGTTESGATGMDSGIAIDGIESFDVSTPSQ